MIASPQHSFCNDPSSDAKTAADAISVAVEGSNGFDSGAGHGSRPQMQPELEEKKKESSVHQGRLSSA